MLYFKKLLGFLQRKIGPFSSREILFWLGGLRPRPKLPRPWAGPACKYTYCHGENHAVDFYWELYGKSSAHQASLQVEGLTS